MNILILAHQSDQFLKTPYFLKTLIPDWTQQGHHVTLATGLAPDLPAADVVFQHVDLTVLPDEYQTALAAYPQVVNRNIVDISKRSFSCLLLSADSDYKGPVIVKTDLNCGGIREGRIAHLNGQALPGIEQGWRHVSMINPAAYPVFKSLKDLPADLWFNPAIVVEKFMPERDETGLFCVRSWVFLGQREIGVLTASEHPVNKAGKYKRKAYFDDIPIEIRRVRERLKMDFGKFDYAMVDGQAVLYDVNRTPTISHTVLTSPVSETLTLIKQKRLSLGLYDFLKGRGNVADSRVS